MKSCDWWQLSELVDGLCDICGGFCQEERSGGELLGVSRPEVYSCWPQ